uniref:NADH:ubiquinone reductase (H(+)-translocating) n=1 Tax=Contracaecum rudolphii B Bullini et al., 1986 TaxID=646521 RepID=E6YBG2_CONRU|nr:NADH dehydrogenase subunit 5 [Contracaecum rudolphii B Bullini et al., 1986]ACP30396.1 NADH dehydrogenase subunit 5 [Contracaecum rudolphii B Bullini et al., 1986]
MDVSIFLMVFSLGFVCVVVLFLPFIKLGVFFVEWDFMSFKVNFYFNSLMFSLILMLVTVSVLFFSTYYLSGELNFNYYYFMLLVFVGSMFSLIYSNSCFTMLLSWDLLGISSFFLVLFYNNWDSCSGAMNTVLTNRLGDFFLFVFFSSVIFSSYYFLSLSFFCCLSSLMLLAASFTKSARFPFSGWLPKAMSAPTPISSLVHSSTLVTAGLVLLMNFSELSLNKEVIIIILMIGIFTMFFSSVAALVEEDLKKVVALSTLSQMGFSMLTLGLGLGFVSFVHLLSHALFKSCLFMQIGYLIHCSFGQQDGRNYSNMGNLPSFIQLQLLVTLFCLCGLVFSSGAVSKDFILEFFFSNSFMVFFALMFFVSVFFTFGYSYRLWKGFFMSFSGPVFNFSSGSIMNFLSLILIFFSIFFIWWLNFNMLALPSLFLYVDFFTPIFFLVFMILLVYLGLKFLLKEFTYKFVVDFLAKDFIYGLVNYKFFDLMLNGLNSKGVGVVSVSSLLGNNYMKSFYFNSIVFLLMLFFFLL